MKIIVDSNIVFSAILSSDNNCNKLFRNIGMGQKSYRNNKNQFRSKNTNCSVCINIL